MKHHSFSGESPLINESKRTVGEKLRQAYEAAVVAVAGKGSPNGCSAPILKEIERRKRSYGVEDPIRTMMFLGSWTHT